MSRGPHNSMGVCILGLSKPILLILVFVNKACSRADVTPFCVTRLSSPGANTKPNSDSADTAMKARMFSIVPEVMNALVISIIIVTLNVVIVTLRFMARTIVGSRLGWDDYLMLAALPQGIGMLICQGLLARTGVGHPLTDVFVNEEYIVKIFLPFTILFCLCTLTVKLSVLIFYFRVFTSKKMRLASKITIAWVTLWGLANIIQSVLVCHFKEGKWTALVDNQCPGFDASQASSGFFNFIANVIISFLPIYTIWSLGKVSISTRCYLSAVFLFSTIVTIVSVARVLFIFAISNSLNPAIVLPETILFTTLEANLGIAINSLPMLLPLYSYWRYRKVWGHAQDEYVWRLRGDPAKPIQPGRQRSAVEDIVSGIPLETIYGVDHVHFSVRVGRGQSHMLPREDGEEAEGWDMDSISRLSRHAQPTGIQIETTWSITEEQTKGQGSSTKSQVRPDDY